jgi:methionyl-tRNA formyltransferase
MRLIFAGTPEFAAIALEALLDAGHEIPLVLTQPDRAAGRGMQLRSSVVKLRAQSRGLQVLQPVNLRTADVEAALSRENPHAMVVAAYGLILPASVLAIPERGCLNIHASLLPRWRGAAPIQRALLAGDCETGISIMQMDAGLDTGAILLQEKTVIADSDTAQTLHDRLAEIGARCIVRALTQTAEPRAQDHTLATYAAKISKVEARIDWTSTTAVIQRQVRAFNPVPGAFTQMSGTGLKIWTAKPAPPRFTGDPGRVLAVLSEGIVVATGDGALTLSKMQVAGGKRLDAAEFVAGHKLVPGAQLG